MPRRPLALRRAGLALLLLWACNAGAAQDGPRSYPASYPNTDGFGVDFEHGEEWYRQCIRVAHASPPVPKAAPGTLRCDATELYYLKRDQETTSPAEWRQVRECAEGSGDDAVLMMLYANGYGVAHDADRAIHHACRLDAAKAEMEARVGYLASGAVATDGQPFDLCDHITSGRMGAVCAAISETRHDRVRTARLDRFAAALPAGAREPFAHLRQAAKAFTRKTADESDMRGSGAAGFALNRMGRREDEFVETLFKAASGAIAPASADRLAQLDRELNAQYQALLARPSDDATNPERLGDSTVSREEVRSTERAWIAYRDAWGPFLAAARLPADLVSVKAQLTRQRIAQLKRIL